MSAPGKQRAVFYGSLLLGSSTLAAVMLWVFSNLHRPLEYMVAGTFATSLGLVGTFVVAVKRRLI